MDTILKKIVEADRLAREMSQQASEGRLKASEEITARRQKVRDDYMERANHRLEVLEKTRAEQAAQKTAEIEQRCNGQMSVLDKQYDAYKASWIDHIVKEVLR